MAHGPHQKTLNLCTGFFLINPARKLVQNPEKILSGYVDKGMTVLEVGSGMGFFSMTLAGLVGNNGRVICVDVEEKMLSKVRKRATRAGLSERITTVQASESSLMLRNYVGKVDFTLAFAVVHEIADKEGLFEQIHRAMKPGSLLLMSEPLIHVSSSDFRREVETAVSKGFEEIDKIKIRLMATVILRKDDQ